MKVVNISLSDLARFTSLKTLKILNDLIKVVVDPTEILVVKVRIIPKSVPMTILKSKMFQVSLKYDLPSAISLIIASTVKMPAKKKFKFSVQMLTDSGCS